MAKQLWAPWRMEFIEDAAGKKPDGCIFCELPNGKDDRANLIVHRASRVFVILNKYPYNNGHLMVVPNLHTSDLTELDPDTLLEMNLFAQKCILALKEKYRPQGYNLGMNLGAAAGAGVKDHLHLHIVPRWNGDTNFMPVIGETKCMPQHLMASYDPLAEWFARQEGK